VSGVAFHGIAQASSTLIQVKLLFLAFENAFVFFDLYEKSVYGKIVKASILGKLESDLPNATIVASLIPLHLGDVVENLNDLS